jgi:hypothetical protein
MIVIPVQEFDQGKLQYLLSKIPEAYVREEVNPSFVRRFYQFPKTANLFQINCYADFYNQARFPSVKVCAVSSMVSPKGDEIRISLNDPELINNLAAGISYYKKFHSDERIYGQSYTGEYKEMFRFMFDCSSICKMSFVVKEAD